MKDFWLCSTVKLPEFAGLEMKKMFAAFAKFKKI